MANVSKAIVLTALGYFLAGWLGQLFAVPPGYATVIWPASGIAISACLLFGYKAVFGVFLGSSLINVAITFSNNGQIALLVPMLIALGSSAQTAFSYFLIRHFIGEHFKFYSIRHVLYFILLAGPIGCLISATVGTSVLSGFGILPEGEAFLNWLSWWMGDSVGVIVLVPWLAVIFRKHFSVYYDRPARVIVALMIVALMTILITTSTAYFELNKQRQAFQNDAELNSTLLSERVKNSVDILYGMAGYIRGSGVVEGYEFYEYGENILRRDRAIKALSINHVVQGSDLDRYETQMQSMYDSSFRVMQRDSDGNLETVSDRSRYVVVGVIYPLKGNAKALGFDVYSEASRRDSIDEAIRLNAAFPTPAITLVQNSKAVLIFLPVYSGAQLHSMATALFDIRDLSERVLGRHSTGSTEVYLTDRRPRQEPYIITASDNATLSAEQLFSGLEEDAFPVVNRSVIPVGAHHWELIHVSHTSFIEQPWGTHFVLVAGLFVAGLLGWVLSLVFSHAAQVEKQVTERTKELSEANDALRESGEKLRQATHEAQEASLAKSRFLANMSHEIRTPLNGMLGSLTLLKSNELSTEQRNLVTLAHQSGDALLDLVNDILDLSKIEAGELELDYRPFNVQDLLEDVASLMYIKAHEKGLRFSVPETLLPEVTVISDRLRVRQVLLNLLGNAIKFSDSGNSVRVVTAMDWEGDSRANLTVRVIDTGIGMTESVQKRLFSRFKQADASTTRRYGGTGLGLAICKELVGALGGEIGVESVLGEGATFWFTIPVEIEHKHQDVKRGFSAEITCACLVSENGEDASYLSVLLAQFGIDLEVRSDLPVVGRPDCLLLVDQAPSQAMAQRIHALNMPCIRLFSQGVEGTEDSHINVLYKPVHRHALWDALEHLMVSQPPDISTTDVEVTECKQDKKVRVLLVEDNLTNQIVAKGLLELFALEVEIARNGQEALDTAREQHFDLIFMDCQMPVMDGYQATRELRMFANDTATPSDVPIIALSANAMKGDDELCFAAGMNDHVAKPISKQCLQEVLERWL